MSLLGGTGQLNSYGYLCNSIVFTYLCRTLARSLPALNTLCLKLNQTRLVYFLTALYVFCRPRFFSFTETRDGYTIIVEDDLCKGEYIHVSLLCKHKLQLYKRSNSKKIRRRVFFVRFC